MGADHGERLADGRSRADPWLRRAATTVCPVDHPPQCVITRATGEPGGAGGAPLAGEFIASLCLHDGLFSPQRGERGAPGPTRLTLTCTPCRCIHASDRAQLSR